MERISLNALRELSEVLARHEVRYLFIGKGGALLHGYPDTTQDADLFVRRTRANGRVLVAAVRELGFDVTDEEARDIERGKDFIQLRDGPFDLDLVFAPDGIERFEDAWKRGVEIDGFPVCSMKDIIASKRAANRTKDREVLRRLEAFEQYQRERGQHGKPLPRLEKEREDGEGSDAVGRLTEPNAATRWATVVGGQAEEIDDDRSPQPPRRSGSGMGC
jgi:hypothetical protein